jgi:hypothetical protein
MLCFGRLYIPIWVGCQDCFVWSPSIVSSVQELIVLQEWSRIRHRIFGSCSQPSVVEFSSTVQLSTESLSMLRYLFRDREAYALSLVWLRWYSSFVISISTSQLDTRFVLWLFTCYYSRELSSSTYLDNYWVVDSTWGRFLWWRNVIWLAYGCIRKPFFHSCTLNCFFSCFGPLHCLLSRAGEATVYSDQRELF